MITAASVMILRFYYIRVNKMQVVEFRPPHEGAVGEQSARVWFR